MLDTEPNNTHDEPGEQGTGSASLTAPTETDVPAKAPRTRRARATRAAGPPVTEPAEPAVGAASAEATAPVEATAAEEPAAPKAKAKTTRTRSTRTTKKTAAATVPAADTPAEPSSAEPVAADPVAVEPAAAEPAAPKAKAKTTRTRAPRAARKAGPPAADAPADTAPAADTPAADSTAEAAPATAQAEPPVRVEVTTTESGAPRARAVRAAGPPQPAEPAQPSRAATRAAGPPSVPAVPGVPAAAADTGVPSRDPIVQAGFSAPESVAPVAMPAFQAPQLIFQAPDPATTPAAPAAPVAADSQPAAAEPADEADEPAAEESGSKRRRRGGRGRSKGKAAEGEETSQDSDEATPGDQPAAQDEAAADGGPVDDGDDADTPEGKARRRRRRRRRGSAADGDQPSPDDPPETVVHVREPRAASPRVKATKDEVQGLKGSTRLEAKKQRRREGRDSGRRRPPIISESEFLARREAVDRAMIVRQRGDRTQIAVLEDGVLVEHYVDKASHQSFVGNVYLGKVQNVLPSMEAAFVDIGKGRNAVLYAGEVNFDASGLEGQTRRIESALKSGQSVLVQATKDPVGHKGARLTSQISLPGRYLVYVPGASMTGISRKLPDTERTRLKSILKKVMPEGAGVIVRTAAEGAAEEELAQDVTRLAAQWENIERKAKSASPPELLSSEPDLTIRVVRDIFNEDFTSLVVSGDDGWDTVDEYVRYVAPHLSERLSRWQDDQDVFAHYRVDEQLAKALDRKVWLPSGGSLVIDRTEAMTVVDVNTGKFTGQGGNLEETVTRNNLEAAEEIVRQLRLRDIGGIIVIDFIDMVLESNRDLVLRRLLECLARDRTKHQVAEVTSLGLVQMTRKRVGSGLLEAFSVPCECCNGRGVIVSLDPADLTQATHHRHGEERSAPEAESNGSSGEDKPGGSRRRRRKAAAPAAVATDPAAAAAVAAIAAATKPGGDNHEANGNGKPASQAEPAADPVAGPAGA